MKRYVIAMLATLLAAALVITSCSSPAPTQAPAPANPAPKPTASPTSSASQTSASQYKFRLQAFPAAAETVYSVVLPDFVKRVKDLSNGRVEITTFPGGTIVPPTEIFKSVGEGIVDMGLESIAYNVGTMPFTGVLDGYPMTWQNDADLLACIHTKGLGDLTQQEFEKRGVHFLGGGLPVQDTFLTVKPLRTQADFQGAKLRGSGSWNTYIGMLGSSAVDMPLTDVYMALTSHTIDGAATGVSAFLSLKCYEVAKYLMTPYPLGASLQDYSINLKTWNALPADIKDALNKAMLDHEAWLASDFDKNYNAGFPAKMVAQGVQEVKVDPQTWTWMQAKATELCNNYAAKDAVAAKAVKIMNDYFKEKGYIK